MLRYDRLFLNLVQCCVLSGLSVVMSAQFSFLKFLAEQLVLRIDQQVSFGELGDFLLARIVPVFIALCLGSKRLVLRIEGLVFTPQRFVCLDCLLHFTEGLVQLSEHLLLNDCGHVELSLTVVVVGVDLEQAAVVASRWLVTVLLLIRHHLLHLHRVHDRAVLLLIALELVVFFVLSSVGSGADEIILLVRIAQVGGVHEVADSFRTRVKRRRIAELLHHVGHGVVLVVEEGR